MKLRSALLVGLGLLGVGRLVRFGKQPVDFKLQAFGNAVKRAASMDWELQLQVKFLFPK